MRNFFLTTVFIFASLGFAFSQFSSPPCVITYNDTGLITPYYDSLPCVEKGQSYSSSVQINIPGVFNSSIVLDSLVITSITGFPSGIAYAQNPSSGVYYGDSSGCIAFAGTTTSDSGAYPLTFNGYAVITTQSSGTQTYSLSQLMQIQDAPVPTYRLNVINQGDYCFPVFAAGVNDLLSSVRFTIFPIPSTGIFSLELTTDKTIEGEVVVSDVTGKIVYKQSLNASGLFKSTINLNNCANGFYLLQIRTSAGVIAKRISIQY